MLFYNCFVFIYSTVAGHKCEITSLSEMKPGTIILSCIVKDHRYNCDQWGLYHPNGPEIIRARGLSRYQGSL